MRDTKVSFIAAVILYLSFLCAPDIVCQARPDTPPDRESLPTNSSGGTAQEQGSFVFRVTAREVVIEFVALEKSGKFVADLTESELHVVEKPSSSMDVPQEITSLRLVQPGIADGQPAASDGGLRLMVGGGCAARFTAHYELAYHPNAEVWKSGYHQVLLATSRPGVKLLYRNRYYVGELGPVESTKKGTTKKAMSELEEAACYKSEVASSITLLARQIQTDRTDSLRYSLLVSADSINFTTMSEDTRRVRLDYGVCMFDRNGSVLEYTNATTEQTLTPEEYRWSQRFGFPHLLEFVTPPNLSLVRFVVRDHATGNIGLAEASVSPTRVDNLNADEQVWQERNKVSRRDLETGVSALLPVGPIGSFGSMISDSTALCGDVYELGYVSALPDFWTLPPIAAIYTRSLNVPNQQYWNAHGIPGVTRRTDYFGVDYHGTFWAKEAGEYEFRLESDDGAKLFIDNQLVIDVDGTHQAERKEGSVTLQPGRHAIHVPYFQGPLGAVALVLEVKPPKGSYKIFDVRDFAPGP